VICSVLRCDVLDQHGHRTLRTNVCDRLLTAVCGGTLETLDNRTFEFCKAVANFRAQPPVDQRKEGTRRLEVDF
jgi:hypothetical protein